MHITSVQPERKVQTGNSIKRKEQAIKQAYKKKSVKCSEIIFDCFRLFVVEAFHLPPECALDRDCVL